MMTTELPQKSKALRERFGFGETKWTEIRKHIGCIGQSMFESDVIKAIREMSRRKRIK